MWNCESRPYITFYWVCTNTGITGIAGITSEYRKNTDYSIYKESPSHAVIMMLPYTRFCYTTSGSPLDSTWNSKNRNHTNIQESHVKWNSKIRMMHAPNPPSRPQWTRFLYFCVIPVFRFCIESGGKPEIVMFAYNLGHFRLTSIQLRRFAASP